MEEPNDYHILKEKLKLHLKDYLEEKHPDGVQGSKEISFRCLAGTHPDNNPSMFVGKKIPQAAKCRTCDATMSIFHMHHMIEGAPMYGRDFVEKNLNVLALKYGYDTIEMAALTEDQLHRMMLFDIHENISEILKAGEGSGLVSRKFVKDLGITDEIATEMGIGTITDYDKMVHLLCQTGGWTPEEIEDAGIKPNMFGPETLTYTVHNPHGRPIAFATRDWRYDGRFGVPHEPHMLDSNGEVRKNTKGQPVVRSKWSNSNSSLIYEKVNTLYGFHKARKYVTDSKVYVVEGYTDAAVLWSYGIENVVCVGSTAFSTKHVQMLKDVDKSIVVICLDNDDAGWQATDRVLAEGFKTVQHIKAQVLLVPETLREDGKADIDPDTFIKVNGKEAFLGLRALSAFEYTITRIPDAFDSDEEKDVFVQRFIPIIMNETSAITQQNMRKAIATKVNVSEALIREYQANLERVQDNERRERLKKEHFRFRRQFEDALNFEPDKAVALANSFKDLVTNSMNSEYVVRMGMQEVLDGFAQWKDERENADPDDLFWHTGWNHWDRALGGIQKSDTFIAVAGPSNHGKSCLLTNLAMNMLAKNDLSKLMVLYWTIDDTKDTLYTKLTALMAKQEIFRVFTFKGQAQAEKAAISASMVKLEKYIRNQNLVVKGSNIGRSGEDVQKWVSLMQEKYPERQIVLLIDNFSNMTGPGDEMQVQKHNIEILHDMRCENNLAIISTFEMNKEGFDGRASTKNMKGTGAILYRCTRTIKVFNEWKDCMMRDQGDPENYWYNDKQQKRPVLECGLGKTKNMGPSNESGNLFFQLEDTMGLITEIGPEVRFKEFQKENNVHRKHTEIGIPNWDSAPEPVKPVQNKTLGPSSESSEQKDPEPVLTIDQNEQDGSSPSAGDIHPSLAHLDDPDGL